MRVTVFKSKQGTVILQNDLEKIHQWSETWGMSFNITKCKVMILNIQKKC